MKLSNLRVNQVGKVFVSELDRADVSARLKDDCFIFREGLVHIDVYAVEIPEGRHRPDFTVWEQFLEFGFGRQADMARLKSICQFDGRATMTNRPSALTITTFANIFSDTCSA